MRLRHPPHLGTIGLLGVVVTSALGCSLPGQVAGRFELPTVFIDRSKVEALSATSAHLRIVLGIHNPNDFSIRTRRVVWRLQIGTQAVADGTYAGHASTPPQGDATVAVPITIPFAALTAPEADTLGEVPYTIDGTLVAGSLLFRRSIPFTLSSVLRINLPLEHAHRVPRAAPATIALGPRAWQRLVPCNVQPEPWNRGL